MVKTELVVIAVVLACLTTWQLTKNHYSDEIERLNRKVNDMMVEQDFMCHAIGGVPLRTVNNPQLESCALHLFEDTSK